MTDGTANRNRNRREKLTRERVVDAALRIMDEEGLDAVSMRRVGRELGVEAMSLYNHVRDKEDLLGRHPSAACYGRVPLPRLRPPSWSETGAGAPRHGAAS